VIFYLCKKKAMSSIKHVLLLPLLVLWLLSGSCRLAFSQGSEVTVMFYNVENLFDTINDPLINDAEFLPEGRYEWTGERYRHKIHQLGRVISSDGSGPFPVLVGLCETENRLVLEELAASDFLRDAGYSIVQYESPDGRGIDVALFYRPALFRVLYSRPLTVRLPSDLEFRTRDILYVQGILGTDTLHIYVNHWPSRVGGKEATEPRRVHAAFVLRQHLDSVAEHFTTFHAIVMGDLNDEPHDRSVHEVLNALIPGHDTPAAGTPKTTLWNLAGTIPEGEGTFWFWRERAWNILDHIIVTESLLNPGPGCRTGAVSIQPGSFRVMKEPWMLKDDNGAMVPFRSYTRTYEGGFSDHLPVMVNLVVKEKPRKKRLRLCRQKN